MFFIFALITIEFLEIMIETELIRQKEYRYILYYAIDKYRYKDVITNRNNDWKTCQKIKNGGTQMYKGIYNDTCMEMEE